jgi:hypothetical protein
MNHLGPKHREGPNVVFHRHHHSLSSLQPLLTSTAICHDSPLRSHIHYHQQYTRHVSDDAKLRRVILARTRDPRARVLDVDLAGRVRIPENPTGHDRLLMCVRSLL